MRVGDKVLIPPKRARFGAKYIPVREATVVKVTPKGSIRISDSDKLFKKSEAGFYTDSKYNSVFKYSEETLKELKAQELEYQKDFEKKEKEKQERLAQIEKEKQEALNNIKKNHNQEYENILNSGITLENGQTLYQGKVSFGNACYIFITVNKVNPSFIYDNKEYEFSYSYANSRRTGSFPSVSSDQANSVQECIENALISLYR